MQCETRLDASVKRCENISPFSVSTNRSSTGISGRGSMVVKVSELTSHNLNNIIQWCAGRTHSICASSGARRQHLAQSITIHFNCISDTENHRVRAFVCLVGVALRYVGVAK